MTHEEFTNEVKKICSSKGIKFIEPSDKEMKLIDLVYLYHPCISDTDGKSQIAYLYAVFGMRLFKDMEHTVHVLDDYEKRIRLLQLELNNLRESRDKVISGEEMVTCVTQSAE